MERNIRPTFGPKQNRFRSHVISGINRHLDGWFPGERPQRRIRSRVALDQTDQVIAKIVGLVENLPLPALPTPFVGLFQRIDGVAEIRNLAKTWQNCLADYLHSINEGTATVYHFNSGGLPAVAFVLRFDRLGWLLNQVKGPKNVDIEPRYLSCHQNTFLDVGIPNCPDVAAIKDLVLQTRWLRRFGN
jgi:hypothetical protein